MSLNCSNQLSFLVVECFEDIALCSLFEVDRRFRGAYCLHYHGSEWPEDGECTHL
jgi:hypothetical protein